MVGGNARKLPKGYGRRGWAESFGGGSTCLAGKARRSGSTRKKESENVFGIVSEPFPTFRERKFGVQGFGSKSFTWKGGRAPSGRRGSIRCLSTRAKALSEREIRQGGRGQYILGKGTNRLQVQGARSVVSVGTSRPRGASASEKRSVNRKRRACQCGKGKEEFPVGGPHPEMEGSVDLGKRGTSY